MIGAFTFVEGGRTFTCAPETRESHLGGTWWWFTVSNDSNRYAAFEAAPGDTQHSVRTRMVAWYERRLWLRSQPEPPRDQRVGRPPKPDALRAKGK